MKSGCSVYRRFVGAVVLSGVAAFAMNSGAAVDFGFDQLFSAETVPPASPTTPWLDAKFTDNGNGTVNLTLSTPHLTGVENVSDFYFDFDSSQVAVANLN